MKSKWLEMKKSSFIEGTFIATLAIIIVKIMGMLYVIPFYAVIGIEGSALYAYAYNIYNIFLDISTIGFPIAMSKITNEYNTLKMMDAKQRAYKIAINIMRFMSIAIFIILFIFARGIATLIISDLSGGNTIEDVTTAIRFVSLAILVIPYLSVTKGYLQGHKIINIPSIGNILEQVIRIVIVLAGSYVVVKLLNKGYALGVDIALLGAFFGGLVSYAYIKIQMSKNKEELGLDDKVKKDKITNKEITKKIISYAIPFIIINTVSSFYNFIDMLLVLRTMEHIGFDAVTVEFIATSISTWASKINMIIVSIAMGMTISLIPSIVEAYTLKKWKDVERRINSSLKMIIFVSLPMAVGLSFLAPSVWSVFYGENIIGASILSLSVFVAVALNIYMVTSSIVQGLNKFKTVYIASITGFVVNAALDVPLMLLCNSINVPAYLGALISSIIGYLSASIIALYIIKKEHKINYKETFKSITKILVPIASMMLVLVLLSLAIKVDLSSRLSCIIYIAINSIIGGLVYIYVSSKMGLLKDIIGQNMIDKIKKKLTFGKL
ncbi:MAG: polysaccharide biosynthesis protein [Firmicutes bacterium]|nr:polysaccharide biosynthesis protein [Bacillota bacterium]